MYVCMYIYIYTSLDMSQNPMTSPPLFERKSYPMIIQNRVISLATIPSIPSYLRVVSLCRAKRPRLALATWHRRGTHVPDPGG